MALQKQLLPLPIDKGLDTKLDPKQEEIGYLRKAENIVYETVRMLRKRNGYDLVELYDTSENLISNPLRLARYRDELLVLTRDKLYSYSSTRQRLVEKGSLYASSTVTRPIAKTANSQTQPDSITVEGFNVFVWKDTSNGVRYSVQDNANSSILVSDALVEAGAERPVLANIGSTVYIIYGNSTAIKFKSFSILSPQTLSSATTVATNRHTTNGLIDAEGSGTKVVVAYNASAAGNDLQLFTIAEGGVPSSILGITSESASHALDVMVDSSSRVVVTFSDNTEVRYLIYPISLSASILSATQIESVAGVTTCCAVETGAGTYKMYYEVSQAGVSNNYIKQANTTVGGSVSGVAVFKRSVGLGTRAFTYNDEIYVVGVHDSEIQSSYFLFNESGYLVTKFASQTAGGLVTYGVLQPVIEFEDSKFLLSLIIHNRVKTDNGVFYSTDGISSATLDFEPAIKYSNATLADGLHICAGIVKYYDGATVTEHGFHVFPEDLGTPTVGSGGSIDVGDYGYVAVYRWTDNNGRDHRSSPTLVPETVNIASGGATHKVTINLPTLRVTDKTNVIIEVYRTEANGTTYYKTGEAANSTTVDTVAFEDTQNDSTLISQELLYTTGGVLENIAAPASYQIVSYNGDRLAILGEDSNRVYFSKQVSEGFPVEFTDAIYRDFDQAGGPLTTIKILGDKLIAMSMDACHFMNGEGPNNLGTQDSFNKPEIISSDIGCVHPDSAVLTPNGLMFKSRKGIWEMTAGLALQYTGARVEQFNGSTVTSANVIGELNQIRFTLDTDRALVYNYNIDRWSTFENHGAIHSITIGNDYYYIREDGALYKENRSTFADAGSTIPLKVETGWLSLVELQGIQRVYHAMLLGTFKSDHKLRVRVAYDFIDAWVQEVVIDVSDFIDGATYGSDSVYGESSPYGGNGNLYQMRVDFARQKCQAIKLSIEDIQDTPGEGLTLSGITLRAGAKAGSNKLPSSNKVGTN